MPLPRLASWLPRRRRASVAARLPACRPPRRRDARGVAALEAALVTPLVMLLVFGTVEMALLIKDNVALTSMVRAGGRIASANAGAGPGGASETGDCGSSCDGKYTPLLARYAADAMASSGSALPKSSIKELWVYKANAQGYPGADGNTSYTSCSVNCVIYKWNATRAQFRYVSGTWESKYINACANRSPDSVGIYLSALHPWNTGLFGATVTIEDHAVFQFEPLPAGACSGNGTDHQ